MERNLLEYYIKNLPKNSVKRACYIAREYMRYSKTCNNSLQVSDGCAVTTDEFFEALQILLAYSHESTNEKDKKVEFCYCENDCSKNYGIGNFCEGEFSIKDDANVLCKKYYCSENI